MRDDKNPNDKKKHHYIPKAYLNGFTDSKGKLFVYRKDSEKNAFHQSPENVGFRNYYYSQPQEDGTKDNNTLEDHFSSYEAKWPPFVERVRNGECVNNQLEFFFQFLTLQMSRTPATRDMIEHLLAESVLEHAKLLDRMGKLPPKPKNHPDILDQAVVSIDPHKSIHAMAEISKGFGVLLDQLGFAVVRNDTGNNFITCDNPVIWFDPSTPNDQMRPHTIQPDGPILFFFPVAKDLAIIGTREAKPHFSELGLYTGQEAKKSFVKTLNRLVARFAYEAFFSTEDIHIDLAKEFSEISPTVETYSVVGKNGLVLMSRRVFGTPRKKTKWQVDI